MEEDDRCINCGWTIKGLKCKISLLPFKYQEILIHWTGIENITDHNLCVSCSDILDKCSDSNETDIPEQKRGHSLVCPACGASLIRKRCSKVTAQYLPYVLKYWPWYSKLRDQTSCCRKCIQRLQRLIAKKETLTAEDLVTTTKENATSKLGNTSSELKTESSKHRSCKHLHNIVKKIHKNYLPKIDSETQNIVLNDGMRASLSHHTCLIKSCGVSREMKHLPKSKRRLFATQYNTYLFNNRLCNKHVTFEHFDYNNISQNLGSTNNMFTVEHLEIFMDTIKQGIEVIDFENVEAMPEHICEYWTGINVNKFVQMYENLKQPKLIKSALAVYLIQKITGDSLKKLAKLFNINSTKLQKHTMLVEAHFKKKKK